MFLRIAVIVSALALGVTGCKRKIEEPPKEPPKDRTMPVKPGAAMHLDKPDQVRVQLDLVQARSSIQIYQQTHGGKSPPNLAETGVHFHFPKDIVYDANSGTIKSKTYPDM